MNPNESSFSDLILVLRRHFRLIAIIYGSILAIFTGVALGWPDSYESAGVIRIENSLGEDRRDLDSYAEYLLDTLADNVFTEDNLEKWVDEFNLYSDAGDLSKQKKMAMLRGKIDTPIVTTPVIDPVSGRERDVVTGFEVSFRSESPEDAQLVASAVVDAILAENRRSRQAKGQKEIDFFKKEADRYRADMMAVEARLAEFKEINSRRLPELMEVNMAAMERVERDLETTQLQIDSLARERVILQSQLDQIPRGSDEASQQLAELQNEYVRMSSIYSENHPDVVSVRKQIDLLSKSVDSSAALPVLRQQKKEIELALREARDKYSDNHPNVRQLIRSQEAIDERIQAISAQSNDSDVDMPSRNDLYVRLDTQIKAIDSQTSTLRARVRELRQKQDEYEGLLLDTPRVESESQELMRDLANVRELYEETQQNLREAELSLALAKGESWEQLVLAQSPNVPRSPAWPPRLPIFFLGLVLALGAGVGIAMIRELTSSAVRNSRNVLELCDAPPIALIPTMYNHHEQALRRMHAVVLIIGIGLIAMVSYLGSLSL